MNSNLQVIKRGSMKKILGIGLAVLVIASCVSKPNKDVEAAKEQPNAEQNVSQPEKERVVNISDADLELYRKNIVVKTMGDDYIVYEYSDVRIDKVAPLASRYCYETNPGKKAYLRDIYMHKNHKRRATFDCVDLASE